MNKIRRQELSKAMAYLNSAKNIVEIVQSREEDYRDNMPENLQESDRYHTAEDACDAMGDAISNLDDAIERLANAIS